MASHEQVDEFAKSPNFTRAEKKLILDWQYRNGGEFYLSLMETMTLADANGLGRLELGFPDDVKAFREWSRGDLAERVRKAGLDI